MDHLVPRPPKSPRFRRLRALGDETPRPLPLGSEGFQDANSPPNVKHLTQCASERVPNQSIGMNN